MCGIAGIAWSAEGRAATREELERLNGPISHRGPDDAGYYLSPERATGAGLAHRRLSIIDLDAGRQPLANEDETVWIVFNGEIYNYVELRGELERAGHRFRTATDTEVIVHLYEEYGSRCVEHLRGMFALAIWDERAGRLFLARDRIGQKPLFYREDAGRLVFASELKSLLQLAGARTGLSLGALNAYLAYQYVPHPQCMLEGYAKLPPAHFAIYEQGRLSIERYWSPPFDVLIENRSPEEWREGLRERLTEAVRLRMRSDVPLGAFLSGGLDSTIIVGIMQELAHEPVNTFSIGFPVAKYDERSYAQEAARKLGTRHHEMVVEPQALEILPKLIWHYDEPFADSSAVPTMYLSEMTRQHVTVSLSGDGGDEMFAGYDRYRAVKLGTLIDRLPRSVRQMLGARLWQRLPASVQQKSMRRRLKRLLSVIDKSPQERYLTWISYFDEPRRRKLLAPAVQRELGDVAECSSFLFDAMNAYPQRDWVTRTTCADILTYLPCDILNKVDIASMAYGLEARSPFLDHRLVEYAARMPIELKQDYRSGKKILVETFRDLLPESIQTRRKMGFGVPIDHWFRHELKPMLYDVLLDNTARQRGYFDMQVVERLVDEHVNRRFDHAYRLWALLCFESWHRMYLDSAVPPAICPSGAGAVIGG